MSCGLDWGEMPRFAVLPDDPAPLRRELARLRAEHGEPADDDLPPEPSEGDIRDD